MDFLSLVIESAAAANHSAGTTGIEYPFHSIRVNVLCEKIGTRAARNPAFIQARVFLLKTHNYGNMLSHMKTTVDIPDELFIAAKKRAAELRQPLRELFERGLRAEISRPATAAGRSKAVKLTWVTVDGGLPTGVDITDRAAMHDWLSGQR